MPRVCHVLVCAALAMLGAACGSNRYIAKNGGAPLYEVSFINTCSRFTGRLYLDEERQNRRKIDVKARAVGSRPYTMRLAAGPHRYYVEFREFEETKFKEGTFVVTGPTRFSMC
jgi:hypothetical protein